MPSRPTQGGSSNTWGNELNAWLDVAHNADGTIRPGAAGAPLVSALANSTAAGDSTLTLASSPAPISAGALLAIDPYSTNCEVRRVTGITGAAVTLAPGATLTSTTITFDAATKRLTSTAETVSTFFPGARITITGSGSNNGVFTVADYPADGSYDATYITVNETVVNEAAGATVTITMNLNRAHSAAAAVLFPAGPVPVTWYGAKPSGSTGDAATNRLGIQRCLDDAYWSGFDDVYFPGFLGGRYYINAPLYWEKLIHLRGPHHKAAVIAADTSFSVWDDNRAMLVTRRNGRTARIEIGGNDRYFISGLGLDGANVAFAKSTGYSGSTPYGTGRVQTGTNTFSIHATKVTRVSEDGGIIYRAIAAGTGGNAVRVAHLGGISQTLAVSVSGNDITVQLGTDGAGTVTSTASAVIAAVNAHVGASALVNATLVDWDNGTGIAGAFALVLLDAGTAPFSSGDVGRSLYVGMRDGAREITAFTNSSTVTVSGTAFTSTRAGLRFAVSPVNGLVGSFNQTSILQDLRIESCPGYGFLVSDAQEFTVRNLMSIFNGTHVRLRNTQFAHFYDTNFEHSVDAYVSCETDVGNIIRSIDFHGGHIEDIGPCDYFRSNLHTFEGFTCSGYQATAHKQSTVLKLRGANSSSYSFRNWQWSGPNTGPVFIDDTIRGYQVLMTDFASGNSFTVPLWAVGPEDAIVAPRRVQSKTATYTARVMDELILMDATGGARTVDLPTAVGLKGLRFTVKRMNSGANAVTVDPFSTQTVDGTATYALATQYDAVTVESDGANWQIVAEPDTTGAGAGGYPRNFASLSYYIAPSASITNELTLLMTLDQALYLPFAVGQTQTFDRLGTHVTTGGTAGAVARLGIYSDSDGIPGARVVDAGTVDATTIGFKELTISQSLTAGMYWIAVVSQVAVSTLRCAAVGNGSEWIGNTSSGGDQRTCNYSQSTVSGALPATATPVNGTTQSPVAKLRAA